MRLKENRSAEAAALWLKPLAVIVALCFAEICAAATPAQRELYIQLGIYRSKVDGSTALQRKAALLATDAVENLDKTILDRQMKAIDENNSKSDLWDDLLEFVPGKLGTVISKINKTTKIYKNINQISLPKDSKQKKDNATWEDQFRNNIDLIQNMAKKNPEFAKTVDKYLSDKMGPIETSAETTLKFYPVFEDHKRLEDIKKLISKNGATEEALIKALNEYKSELAKKIKQAQDVPVVSYERQMQAISEQRIYLKLASRLLQGSNPDDARLLGDVGQAVIDAQEINANLNYGKLTAAAATCNYIIIAIALIDSFETAPNPNQALQQQLVEISKQIQQLGVALIGRMELLQDTSELILQLASLNFEIGLSNESLLRDLHVKANNLREEIFDQGRVQYLQLQAGFERPFALALETAFAHKKTHRPGDFKMTDEKFDKSLADFLAVTNQYSQDYLAVANNLDSSADQISNTLFSRPLESNLTHLGTLLNVHAGLTTADPKRNFDLWKRGTIAMVNLIGDWPTQQKRLRPEFIDDLLSQAVIFENFFTSLQCAKNSPAFNKLLASETGWASQIIQATSLELKTVLQRTIDQTLIFQASDIPIEQLRNANKTSRLDLLRLLIPKNQTITVTYSGRNFSRIGSGTIAVPKKLLLALPASIKAAILLKKGKIEYSLSKYENDTDEGREWRDELVVKFIYSNENNTTTEYSILKISKSGIGPRIIYTFIGPLPTIEERSTTDLNHVLSSAGELIADPASTSAVTNLIHADVDKFFESIVDTAKINSFAANVEIEKMVSSAAGLHDLINQYLAIGCWEQTRNNEKLDSLTIGKGSALAIALTGKIFSDISAVEAITKIGSISNEINSELSKAIDATPIVATKLPIKSDLRDLRESLRSGTAWRTEFARKYAFSTATTIRRRITHKSIGHFQKPALQP